MIRILMQRSILERRRRLAARIALYGSLAIVVGAAYGLLGLLGKPLRQRNGEKFATADLPNRPEVKLLQRYVQIDTSETTGSEVRGARFLAEQLAAAGIPSQIEILNGHHANFYAWVKGQDPHPLVLHHHIDVKDVDPRQWFYPPYAGTIELPWIYGRGVFDMKSVAIAQLMALIELKKSGRPLKHSVLLLGTSSEESGSELGVRWILREHPDLVNSFWAVLTEGGIVEARTRDDVKYWGTEVAQKHFVDLEVCSSDRAPLEQLQKELIATGHTHTDLRLTPAAKLTFAYYGPTRDREELRSVLAHPESTVKDPAAFLKLPGYLQSMLRDEINPFPIEAAPGGGYQLPIKLHLLPGTKVADVIDRLLPPWMLGGLPVSIHEEPASPDPSPIDHPVFREIVATLKREYPDTPVGPYFLPWSATDSRFFRYAGVPSYGFSPFLIMSTDTFQVDAPNERMALPGFVEGVAIYRQVLERLLL